jgi:predicted AlkP superfamily phosphohydrolase/phosphomutase
MATTPAQRLVTFASLTLCVLAAACSSGGPQPEVRAERVLMVSYDAVGADLAWAWIGDGTASEPDGLTGMAAQGLAAARLRMVDPTHTSVQHASLVTGRDAAGTGIVGNLYHRLGTPISELVSGFNATPAAPTLWQAARRRELKVATLMWPGADGGAPERQGDLGTLWPGPAVAPAEVVELLPESAASTGELPSYDGLAPLLWRLSIDLPGTAPAAVEVLVALLDAEPDGRPRYDAVAARTAAATDWSYAAEYEWLEIDFDAQGPQDPYPRRYGAWCKVLRVDRVTGGLRFFRGGANRLTAYPRAFEERAAAALGPWPGEPEAELVGDWWLDLDRGIDLDTFVEQAERLDRYLDRLTALVLAEEDVQLVLAYHSSADVYQHASLITEPRQWAFSPGRALAAAEGLKRIGRSVDASVAAAWGALDPSRDALVVVSDHGHLPVFEVVRVNRALADAGLVRIEGEGAAARIAADTPMLAVAGGGAVHIYLNLKVREPGGVVPTAEATTLLQRAARVLADLEAEGVPAVERIVSRGEASAIGLGHPDAGDLIVFLAPGFAASNELAGPALGPSRSYGQHGFLASHDAMCGILFARGAGIAPARLGEQPATAVAPMVASWLGLELTAR